VWSEMKWTNLINSDLYSIVCLRNAKLNIAEKQVLHNIKSKSK